MKNNRPLIFITNDDSIHAKGLESLIEMVQPFGDLFVVAPMDQQSCMSHALTLKDPLRVRKIKEEPGLIVYACNGTPADCVKIGLGELIPHRPQLLVSGINHGDNSSVNIVYSGTVAAAAEGVLYGIPSIAFSLCSHSHDADFSAVVHYGRKIVETVLEKGLPKNVGLNVNAPNLPFNEIKGICLTRQNKGTWSEELEKRVDPHGYDYYWFDGNYINHEPESTDSDGAALEKGYIAVVPIQFDFTAYDALNQLKDDWKDFNLQIE